MIALVVLLSAASLYFAGKVTFDSRIEIWFLEGDPGLVAYEAFLERFQADEMAVVGVFADDVFQPKVLEVVDRITREAEHVPYAHRVRSLTEVRIARNVDGFVDISPLIENMPPSAEESEALREEVLNHPILNGTLVSGDGKATAVLVELDEEGNSFEGKEAMTLALREIVEAVQTEGIDLRLAGTPPLDKAFLDYGNRDWKLLGPLAVVLVLIVTFLVFRRISAALVPLSVVLLAVLWLYGLMGLLGLQVNIVSTSLMAVVLAVGSPTRSTSCPTTTSTSWRASRPTWRWSGAWPRS